MAAGPRTIWLVRHGNRRDFIDPEWLRTAERPHDGPLSADGEVQARETGERLARERVDHVFSSPFIRAAQTASIIAARLGLPVRIEPGLSETLLDRWFPERHDLLDARDLAQLFPGIDTAYESPFRPIFPETREDMLRRTAAVAERLTTRFEGNLVLVGHGGSFAGLALALSGGCAIHPALCCLIRFERREGSWVLAADGSDTSHLSAPPAPLRLH